METGVSVSDRTVINQLNEIDLHPGKPKKSSTDI